MLGENIIKLRKARNLSQVDLAKTLYVSKQTLSNWENGKVMPSVEMLMNIARYFSVTPDYLLDIYCKEYIDTEGLTPEQIALLKLVINNMKNKDPP